MLKNKNCIFFAISDNFAFAVANVLMGLKKHSNKLLNNCDVIIFSNKELPPRGQGAAWKIT